VSDSRIGTRISGFTIVSRLGQGGMGVVYLAEHGRLDRRVALKLLNPEAATDEELRRRFVDREPRLAASVDHPNILPIYDAGEEPDGTLWLAMRLVDGSDLGRLLRTEGPLDPPRTIHLLTQLADALDAANRRGLVHRDVKPENVLVEGEPPREHVYLTDFGLTRRMSTGNITAAGALMGTIQYVSPEMIASPSEVDGRADEYSLGCVLFQCLTGVVPFPHPTDIAILYSHMSDQPPKPTTWRHDLPPRIDEVVRIAMAKSPDDRYPTCGALMEAAANALSEGAVTRRLTRPDVTPPTEDSEEDRTTMVIPAGLATVVGDGISAELIPLESRGRTTARHQVRIENHGTAANRVRVGGGRKMPTVAEASPESFVVAPGAVAWSGIWVRPVRSRALLRRRLGVRVEVEPERSERITLDGVMVRPVPVLTWSVLVVVIASLVVGVLVLTRPVTEATCPLTGMPPPPGATPGAPALAVKVDNNPVGRDQQRGLSQADVVFEEPIESGATRLVAVFNCSFPLEVGLVRGPRPTDTALLTELGRPLFSFGNDRLAQPLDLRGVVDVSEAIEPNGYHRTDAEAPCNLFALPARLLATRTSRAPAALFRYSAKAPRGRAQGLTVRIPFENLVWRFNEGSGTYQRSYGDQPHVSDGTQISAANVIVQRVRIDRPKIAGQTWVRAMTVGHGEAVVYRNGVEIPGTWSRPVPGRPPVFRDRAQAEITMAPGTTWVELVPTGSTATAWLSPKPELCPTPGSSPTPASGAPT
jgi:serine/threonine-protein kinase